MSKGKQPYIPLYIGDWEQDTNCLSIEAEGAWLKLTLKLWKSKDRGLLLISFSQMAILFKKSPEKTLEIFEELADSDIFDYEKVKENMVLIKSRRMIRDVELAKVRSENGSKGGRGNKANKKLNESKQKANKKLNTEYEYDIDNEYKGIKEEGVGETIKGDFSFDLETVLPLVALEAVERNQFTHTKGSNTEYILSQWNVFLSERINDPPDQRRQYRRIEDLTKYFINWMRNKFPKNAGNSQTRQSRNDASAKWLVNSLRDDIANTGA